MRQIVFDTETTGLDPASGHRIIEIGAVELFDRKTTNNHFHFYLNPDRLVEQEAIEVHGITNEFLADKPRFEDVAESFLEFVKGADLIAHNAAFDVGFLNHELQRYDPGKGLIEDYGRIVDTLEMARKLHPGMKNSLDALCKRYDVDNSKRELHGALLDAQILADVYLAMTGGQTSLSLRINTPQQFEDQDDVEGNAVRQIRVLKATEEEISAHDQRLSEIAEQCGSTPLWHEVVSSSEAG